MLLFASEFIKAMHRYGRTRRRDGVSQWGICRDTEDSNRYLEMFLVNSWREHLRQHERLTKADRELEERIRSYTLKEPTVRHLIYAPHQEPSFLCRRIALTCSEFLLRQRHHYSLSLGNRIECRLIDVQVRHDQFRWSVREPFR
jgi:hypothetical protein